MEVISFNLNLTSEDPARLGAFYRDVVGLPAAANMGEHAFMAGDTAFLIDGHSDTVGQAQEPHRALINFFVADLEAEQQRLEAAGVKFIRTAGEEFWGGVISTFVDPDGNYAQLIESRSE